ncbi:hypothetical protein N9226_00300 [bacterium]|nr:hypothetical protein [bacterium]
MSEEYGDAVNVLFVEVQGADDAKVERFALEKRDGEPGEAGRKAHLSLVS